MAINFYLAMMAEEISNYASFPENTAFIYCPFDAKADISRDIPPDVILVLTDSSPVKPELAEPVAHWIRRSCCKAVLLDFQLPEQKNSGLFARNLQQMLTCPVVISECYASDLDCPVFLSPLPHHRALQDHIAPWAGREIWLDIHPMSEQLLLTEQGAAIRTISDFYAAEHSHADSRLHCHYSIALEQNAANFTFWRTDEDWQALMEEMEQCGIHHAIGLYQEWAKKNRPGSPERF